MLRRDQKGVRFRRQEPVGSYIADFLSYDLMLIIEADGEHHIGSQHDLRRDEFLMARGFLTRRFLNQDVALSPNWVSEEIDETIRELMTKDLDNLPRD